MYTNIISITLFGKASHAISSILKIGLISAKASLLQGERTNPWGSPGAH